MDIVRIEPCMLKGTVTVPPSKSIAHRAILSAALSGGRCRIRNVAMSKDIQATLDCVKALGYEAEYDAKHGVLQCCGHSAKELAEELHLFCGESGSTLRFLMPLALLSGRRIVLHGNGRLMQRPQKPYLDLFAKKGIVCVQNADSIMMQGELKAGLFELAGNVSSQFITGLLFALPLLPQESEIRLTTLLESKGYVDLTLSVLRDFGIVVKNEHYRRFVIPGGQTYQPKDYTIEGDYSQAAFFLTAGALGCDVACRGLNPDSLQGDKKILELLKQAGAKIHVAKDGTVKAERTNRMTGIRADASEIPDLVPILAVLAAFCSGESLIYNAGRLRMKESDRLAATARELRHLGVSIQEGSDWLKIVGGDVLSGTTVSAWNDHRIAMAIAIAACRAEGTVGITGAKTAVGKSYPDFFEVYQRLCVGPKPTLGYGTIITEELR